MIGKRISHYEILEQLGKGGMGVVYKARDTRLDRFVALKFLPADLGADVEANERFMQEAKAASALDDSNICSVYDIGQTEDGLLFIVMPYYDGQTLKYLIQDGPLGIEKSIDIAVQVANGLERAHDSGIVHRDIKPANIMVTDRGEVKILDFGVAKLQQGLDITKTGTTLGTVWYMSPEQARGDTVDRRSDLWSLGILLYEMLTGTRPFLGDYDQAIVYSILNDDPAPIAEADPAVSSRVLAVVQKLLSKSPDDRYQTASEAAAALEDSRPTGQTPAAETQPASGRWRWWGAAAIFVILVAAGALSLLRRQHDQVADAARGSRETATLAVLPFSNLKADPATDFLGYALADQVIGSLEYVSNLTVRPSNSVRKYQNGDYDLDEVKKDLSVDYILAGNYLQQGDRMRLTVEFIDLNTKETVWREPIEVASQDAFEMQDLVAERLLSKLRVSFSDDERGRMQADVSRNPQAYEYYLRAISYPMDAAGNRAALDLLENSIALDSTFAPVWAALGRRFQLAGYWELGGPEFYDKARTAYLKALELNPDHLGARLYLTMLYTDTGETDLAMTTATRMLEINPNSSEALFARGYVERYAGMLSESAADMDAALAINPTNPTFRSAGWTYICVDRYDDALSAFRLGPEQLVTAWEGEFALRRSQFDLARRKLEAAIAVDSEGIIGLWATAVLSALEGDYDRGIRAAEIQESANPSDGEGWHFLAGNYCINGAVEQCISALGTAVDRGYFPYPHLLKCRFLDAARGNPEFDAVLERARIKHEAFKKKFF